MKLSRCLFSSNFPPSQQFSHLTITCNCNKFSKYHHLNPCTDFLSSNETLKHIRNNFDSFCFLSRSRFFTLSFFTLSSKHQLNMQISVEFNKIANIASEKHKKCFMKIYRSRKNRETRSLKIEKCWLGFWNVMIYCWFLRRQLLTYTYTQSLSGAINSIS